MIAMVELAPGGILLILVYFMLPLIPFIIGGILFYFKPKRRVSIGISLILFGVLELSFSLSEYWFIYGVYGVIGLLTILLGTISVLYPKLLSKDNRIKK